MEALAKKLLQTEAQLVLGNCAEVLVKMLLSTPGTASNALEAALEGSSISDRVAIKHGKPEGSEDQLRVIRATAKYENGLMVWVVVPDVSAVRVHFTLPSDREKE